MTLRRAALTIALTIAVPAGAQDVSKYSEEAVRQDLTDKAVVETIERGTARSPNRDPAGSEGAGRSGSG